MSYELDGYEFYLVMILEPKDLFTEWAVYIDVEEAFRDVGRYVRAAKSGVTRFEYDDWPDGNFVGRVDGANIYSVEGRYTRIDQSNPNEDRSLPRIVQSVLP